MQTRINPRKLLTVFLVAVPILCLCVLIFRIVVRNADVVHPSAETESAFLRGYTLANATKLGIPLWSTLSGPDSAGRGCVFHQREFQSWFAIASENEAGVMILARQDLQSRLSRDGSQIVAARGDPGEGFQFKYATGTIKGAVILDPILMEDSTSVAGKAALHLGQTAFHLRVRISETWYKTPDAVCKRL